MRFYKIILPEVKIFCFTLFSLFCISVSTQGQSQMRYLRANNCDCTFGTLTNSSAIEWYGACSNGYCDGYGTVRYYDPEGNYNGKYVGDVSAGILNGFGTRYYSDGTIAYQGSYRYNQAVDQAPFALLSNVIGDFVIDSLLSGGINRQCEIVKSIFSRDDVLQEIRYRISCDGQIMSSNHYTCTLVISNRSPHIDMVNVNDNAQVFITLNLIRYTKMMYDWFERQSNNR